MLSFQGVPRFAVIVILILALIGAVWFWKRWKSSSADKETENVKAARNAAVYADNIARYAELEQTPAVTDEYTAEVARGLQTSDSELEDITDDMEDMDDMEDDDASDMEDEPYEPMD